MKELLYPATQIILSVLELASESKYFSAKIKFLTMLNDLSINCKKFVPIAHMVFKLMEMKQLIHQPSQHYKNKNQSKQKKVLPMNNINLQFKLKALSDITNTKEFYLSAHEECLFLLISHLTVHCKSIAFPEMCYPILRYLKKYTKTHSRSMNPGVLKRITNFIKTINENIKTINQYKSTIDFSPVNQKQTTSFLNQVNIKMPLQKLYESEKKKMEDEKTQSIAFMLGEEIVIHGNDDNDNKLNRHEKTKRNNTNVNEKLKRKREGEEEQSLNNNNSDEKQKKKKKKKKKDTVKEFNLDEF
jgi:nucleolar complex protein 2